MEDQERGGTLLPNQVKDHLAKMYTLPKVVSFCNERLPLDRWDVWQRLDSEFFSFLVDQRQVILWLKRTGQFFPYIEEELEHAGLPDDLKYVTIVESGPTRGRDVLAQARPVFGNLSNQPVMLMIWSKYSWLD